jgi:hypothetical protein
VQGIVNVGTGGLTIHYDPASKRFSFEGGERFHTERIYERGSGKPKVLSRIPTGADGTWFDTIDAIQGSFDLLTAIDTNTRRIGARQCSVTGVTVAQKAWAGPANGPLRECWQYFTPFGVEFSNLEHSPEKAGWSVALQSLEQQKFITRSARLGIVVDAYLSEHEAINARKLPFDGYNYLPPRWALLYATSDAGKEDFVNQLIGCSDRFSRAAMARLASDNVPPPDPSTGRPGVWGGVRLLFPNAYA